MSTKLGFSILAAVLLSSLGASVGHAQQSDIGFFITSAGPGKDRTCGNWTKSGQGSAMVGNHDRQGLRDDDASKSWNSSHPSRGPDGGCSQNDLKSTGGNGLFYCFASK